MGITAIAILFNAYKDKNWSKLGALAILFTLVPLFGGINTIENEIKKREMPKE